jgi:phage gpG-like protein
MSKTISFGLSVKEIQSAIKQVEAYKKELTVKCQRLVEVLTAKGIDIAKFHVRDLGAFYTGELESSIGGYYSPSLGTGIIYAGSFYAVWVEFGSGMVGEQSPHPLAGQVGYVYDVNDHGSAGWTYFNDSDGKYHWTTGMPSRPFMYLTAKELDAICEKVAKQVFKA